MDRRQMLKSISGIAVGTVLAGCLDGMGGGTTGTLATKVSDQPGDISDFETLMVQISGIRVKPQDADLKQLDADAEVDLVTLTGDASALVEETELETGTYEFLMLEAQTTDAVLKQGGSATVMVPGDAPLKFNKQFEIRSGLTTTFIADFTPVKRGQTNRYVLKPVADEVHVIYEAQTTTQ